MTRNVDIVESRTVWQGFFRGDRLRPRHRLVRRESVRQTRACREDDLRVDASRNDRNIGFAGAARSLD